MIQPPIALTELSLYTTEPVGLDRPVSDKLGEVMDGQPSPKIPSKITVGYKLLSHMQIIADLSK